MEAKLKAGISATILPRPIKLAGKVAAGVAAAYRLPSRTVEAGRQILLDASGAVDQGVVLAARVLALLDAVDALVNDISVITARAGGVVSKAETVAAEAGTAVLIANTQLLRTQEILDMFAPQLLRLQPVLSHGATVLEPRHMEAVSQLLDLTPDVIDFISPALKNLGDLTPELHQLAERFDAIGQIVEGIPGAGLFKRRGASDDGEPE